jgi:hypothetical protein
MYQLLKPNEFGSIPQSVFRVKDTTFIPFVPANTDYANFKKEVLAGAELQDADGNTMTAAEAQEYVATLP